MFAVKTEVKEEERKARSTIARDFLHNDETLLAYDGIGLILSREEKEWRIARTHPHDAGGSEKQTVQEVRNDESNASAFLDLIFVEV